MATVSLSAVGDYTLQVETDCPIAKSVIENSLTFDIPGAFVAKRRNPRLADWDGKKRLYRYEGADCLLTSYGLKHRVVASLDKKRITYSDQVKDWEALPYYHLIEKIKDTRGAWVNVTLDAIQEEACQILLVNRRCSIVLGTASGKTELLVNAIMCTLKAHPAYRFAVMVPKRVLLMDTFRRVKDHFSYFEKGRYKVGLVGDGHKDFDAQIVVCTAATAAASANTKDPQAILEWRRRVDVLILDEAHNSTAAGWRKVIEDDSGYAYIWAVSGKLTYQVKEKELKQAELELLFGAPLLVGNNTKRQCPVKVVHYDPPEWRGLMADRELATSLQGEVGCSFILPGETRWRRGVRISPDFEGRVPEWMLETDSKGRTTVNKDLYGIYMDGELVHPIPESIVYDTVHDWGYVECAFRNDWILNLAKLFEVRGEAYMVSLSRVRHVKKLYKLALSRGLSVGALSASMSGKAQQHVVACLREGKIGGIISHWKPIGEGIDIPRLRHLIKADGMTEEQILEQQKGRVQRAHPGKDFGYVHLPSDTHINVLAAKTRKVLSYFNTIGLTVEKVDGTRLA